MSLSVNCLPFMFNTKEPWGASTRNIWRVRSVNQTVRNSISMRAHPRKEENRSTKTPSI